MASKYYTCREFAKLNVEIGEADRTKGETQAPSVQFVPFEEKWEGDKVYVGYLETDNATAQKILANDPNVEEIEKDQYERATGEKAVKANI